MEIRNIAIIAHVDHGKTTLTDALMRQTGAAKEGISMDSNILELERGITIYAKKSVRSRKNTAEWGCGGIRQLAEEAVNSPDWFGKKFGFHSGYTAT